jgi:hypothetical protein
MERKLTRKRDLENRRKDSLEACTAFYSWRLWSCYEGKALKVSCIHIYPTFSLLPYRAYVADGLARRLVIWRFAYTPRQTARPGIFVQSIVRTQVSEMNDQQGPDSVHFGTTVEWARIASELGFSHACG